MSIACLVSAYATDRGCLPAPYSPPDKRGKILQIIINNPHSGELPSLWFLVPNPFCKGENAGSSFGILVMHPFNFLPGLQPGKEGQQGIISGVIRLKSFVEQFLKVGSFLRESHFTGHLLLYY